MPILADEFKKSIADLIEKNLNKIALAANKEANFNAKDIYQLLSIPPSFELGQAALPCFPFAKTLKQAPQKVAEILATAIAQENSKYIQKIEQINGYLNFHCNFEVYGLYLSTVINNGNYFDQSLLEKEEQEKIVIEYSQPNTHKALHIGHLRTLFLGDAVARALKQIGNKVVKVTYPGDMGTHVAKVLWYITTKLNSKLPKSDYAKWLGEIYPLAQQEFDNAAATGDSEALKKELSFIFAEVKKEHGDYYELWKLTREWSLQEMKNVYDWANVQFDTWYSESECDKPSAALVKQKFAEGFFEKSEGAVGKDLSEWNLGFAIFLKSDGHGLYLTKDLELLQQKFADPEVTRSIYVVDARQKLHFKQLFKTAELMGYAQAASSVHLSYETVNTQDGKAFASRSGGVIPLADLRRAMEQKVKTDYLEQYRGIWSEQDIEQTAIDVTLGALKFGLLKVDNNTQVTFILDEWLKLDGDTGPYLQYVHARCNTIIEKQGKASSITELTISELAEKELIFSLGKFNDVLLQSATQYRPSTFAAYLLELARTFNRFYENCPIKSSSGNIRETRLTLVTATRNAIASGLQIFGIVPLQKM